MKTVTRYAIRKYETELSYSKVMGRKLRHRSAAIKLVNRLKKMGHKVFMSPMQITVPN
jgi:hypothetical protein